MSPSKWALASGVIVLAAGAGFLAWDNHRLRDQLAAARAESAVTASTVEASSPPARAQAESAAPEQRRGFGGWLRRLGGGKSGAQPALAGGDREETRAERR